MLSHTPVPFLRASQLEEEHTYLTENRAAARWPDRGFQAVREGESSQLPSVEKWVKSKINERAEVSFGRDKENEHIATVLQTYWSQQPSYTLPF